MDSYYRGSGLQEKVNLLILSMNYNYQVGLSGNNGHFVLERNHHVLYLMTKFKHYYWLING